MGVMAIFKRITPPGALANAINRWLSAENVNELAQPLWPVSGGSCSHVAVFNSPIS